jgi:glycosyltransferase involved in cell wall biosynthesis
VKRALQPLDSDTTIIISHGCWKSPTLWGHTARTMGFRWLTLPHGMLEPWSMQQKWLKKKVYFNLIEKSRLIKADDFIAVSKDEQKRLSALFGRSVLHFPNGIEPYPGSIEKPTEKVKVLFMARLHHKKGVLPLLQAWRDSALADHSKYELNIAGPDDGELPQIEQFLAEHPLDNVYILGPVYGEAKLQLLKESHVYLLPSQSEGFPTSILEAATYGCYPAFTAGCNFNEAIEEGVAFKITPDPNDIRIFLNDIAKRSPKEIISKGLKTKAFVDTHYNLQNIGQSYLRLFEKSLRNTTVE